MDPATVAEAGSELRMALARVVLPEPLTPITPTLSPGKTSKLMLEITVEDAPEYKTDKLVTRITGAVLSGWLSNCEPSRSVIS
jgi:hypothetical protein